MSNDTNTFSISTKADKDSPARKTSLTVNWDDCPESTIRALATQQLVVRVQAGWRKHGIPEKATVNVRDFGPGMRHVGITGEQAAAIALEQAKLDPAKRAALLAQLQALEAAEKQQAAA